MVGSSWEEAGGGREIEAVKICSDDYWERYLGYVRLYMHDYLFLHFVYHRHWERVDSRAAPCNAASIWCDDDQSWEQPSTVPGMVTTPTLKRGKRP